MNGTVWHSVYSDRDIIEKMFMSFIKDYIYSLVKLCSHFVIKLGVLKWPEIF